MSSRSLSMVLSRELEMNIVDGITNIQTLILWLKYGGRK